MKTYKVSFDILASRMTTGVQISEILGINSKELDFKEFEDTTVWKIQSDCEEQKAINEHILSILSKITKRQNSKNELIKKVVLNIGVFYDTITCSVNIGSEHLNKLSSFFPDFEIEATCYPIEEAM